MAIQAVSGKAQEAADLANATAEAYKEYRESRRKDLSDSGIQSLLSYSEKLRREIEEAQTNADRLRQRLNLSDLAATEYTGPLLTAESLKHINALRIESAA
jgi:predicted RNase H-like nuclease (RuvC/YqgF family)